MNETLCHQGLPRTHSCRCSSNQRTAVCIFGTHKPWAVSARGQHKLIAGVWRFCCSPRQHCSLRVTGFSYCCLRQATRATLLGYPFYCSSHLTTLYQHNTLHSIGCVFRRTWKYRVSSGESWSTSMITWWTSQWHFLYLPRDETSAKSLIQATASLAWAGYLYTTKRNIKAFIEFKTETDFVLYSTVILDLQQRINQPKALAL